jgi:hypothetical protein
MYDAVTIVVPGISAASDPVADTVATSGDELDQTTPPSTGWVLPLLKSSRGTEKHRLADADRRCGPRILTPTNVMGVTGVSGRRRRWRGLVVARQADRQQGEDGSDRQGAASRRGEHFSAP